MSDPQEPLRQILDTQAGDIVSSQIEQELRRRQVEIVHEYSLKIVEAKLLDKQRVGGYSLKTVKDKSETPKQ